MICICYRIDGAIEIHEMPRGDPILAKLILQDLELSCTKVECLKNRSVAEVRVCG